MCHTHIEWPASRCTLLHSDMNEIGGIGRPRCVSVCVYRSTNFRVAVCCCCLTSTRDECVLSMVFVIHIYGLNSRNVSLRNRRICVG